MIIGLLGFIGSGKGTAGDILAAKHGFVQDSFARPLKDAVSAMFGWDRQMLEGATAESRAWREQPDAFWTEKFGFPFTPRQALQLMGTEAGRNVFHKDLWVISLIQRNQGHNVVITDVRFKNEIKAVHENGGIIVRVSRGPEPDWYDVARDANHGDEIAQLAMQKSGIHSSEWDWIGCPINHTIYNDGTLTELENAIRYVIENQNLFLTSL